MSTNNLDPEDDTQELINNQANFLKDSKSNFADADDDKKEEDKGLDDAYLIELLGRLTMIKNELDYNRVTNYIWLVLTIGMAAVI